MSDRIELAGRKCAAYEAVSGGFFEYDLTVFTEKFDQIRCASFVALVFGLKFCKFSRASFNKFADTVGNDLRDLLRAGTRFLCFAPECFNARSARDDNVILRLNIGIRRVSREDAY